MIRMIACDPTFHGEAHQVRVYVEHDDAKEFARSWRRTTDRKVELFKRQIRAGNLVIPVSVVIVR